MIIKVLQEKTKEGFQFEYTIFDKTFIYIGQGPINKVMQNIGVDIMVHLTDSKMTPTNVLTIIDSIEFKLYNYLGTAESPNIYKLKEIF